MQIRVLQSPPLLPALLLPRRSHHTEDVGFNSDEGRGKGEELWARERVVSPRTRERGEVVDLVQRASHALRPEDEQRGAHRKRELARRERTTSGSDSSNFGSTEGAHRQRTCSLQACPEIQHLALMTKAHTNRGCEISSSLSWYHVTVTGIEQVRRGPSRESVAEALQAHSLAPAHQGHGTETFKTDI